MKIPMIINRCLAYGVKIFPYQLNTVLSMAEKYPIPDEELGKFTDKQIKEYVNGLYLSGQEMSNDWSRGHLILKSIGFDEVTHTQEHRKFISMQWNPKVNTEI